MTHAVPTRRPSDVQAVGHALRGAKVVVSGQPVQGGHSDRALKRTAGLRLGGGTARTGQPYCRSRAGGTPMGRLSAPRTLVVTHGPRAEGPGRAFERSPQIGRAHV